MSKWWIESGQIIGLAIEGIDAPSNFQEVEGEDADDREAVYFDGTTVLLKPERPSDHHYWNDDAQEWIEATSAIEPTNEPDWVGLVDWLRGSLYFERVYGASKLTAGANTAATLLLMTINQSRNLQDLAFVLPDLLGEIEAIAAQGYIPAFTTAEKQALADKLTDLNFPDSVVAPLANV
jgi:hypothetical protein